MKQIKVNILMSTLFMVLLLGFTYAQQDTGYIPNQQSQWETQSDTGQADDQYSQNAQELTDDLSSQLSLTDQQSEEIQNILVDYQEALFEKPAATDTAGYDVQGEEREMLGGTSQSGINERIKEVLDSNQQEMFTDYQAEWWEKVNEKISKETETDTDLEEKEYQEEE